MGSRTTSIRTVTAFRATKRYPLLQAAKTAIATIAAWLVAGWIVHDAQPVFGAIAALLVVQPSVNQSLTKGVERTVGVVAGVLVAALLSLWLGSGTLAVVLSVVLALLVAWSLRMTAGTSNQVVISAMLVIALGTNEPGYAANRIVETFIGAAIGIVVNIAIVPPIAVAPAATAVRRLGHELAEVLEALAHALDRPLPRDEVEAVLADARALQGLRVEASSAIEVAKESLALNPRARARQRDLEDVSEVLATLSPVVTQTNGMARAVADHYDPSVVTEPTARAIVEQLRRTAHDVRLALRRPGDARREEYDDVVPALTSPLVVRTPSASHWVLIGSLLEDLRRIHEELTERVDR